MKNSRCSSCKKKIAVRYNEDWDVDLILCEYEPMEFTWINPQMECSNYEPNLHVNNAAPNNTQARNNGIHQE